MPIKAIHAIRYRELIIDGHRSTGLADDERPLEFGNPVLATFTTGASGAMSAMATGNIGSPLTAKYQPDSETVRWWLLRRAEWLRGMRRVMDGIYTDSGLDITLALHGIVIESIPPIMEPESTLR